MKHREPISISNIRLIVRILKRDPFVKADNMALQACASHLVDLETFRARCL
jgi:hypothetical protein